MGTFRQLEGYPQVPRYLSADWNESIVGSAPQVIGTLSLASCLAVTLFDPRRRIGSITHLTPLDYFEGVPDGLLPENLVDTLISQMGLGSDATYAHLEATLVGESKVSQDERKVTPVLQRLEQLNIPVIGTDIGDLPANKYRNVFLFCETGNVDVYRSSISGR